MHQLINRIPKAHSKCLSGVGLEPHGTLTKKELNLNRKLIGPPMCKVRGKAGRPRARRRCTVPRRARPGPWPDVMLLGHVLPLSPTVEAHVQTLAATLFLSLSCFLPSPARLLTRTRKSGEQASEAPSVKCTCTGRRTIQFFGSASARLLDQLLLVRSIFCYSSPSVRSGASVRP